MCTSRATFWVWNASPMRRPASALRSLCLVAVPLAGSLLLPSRPPPAAGSGPPVGRADRRELLHAALLGSLAASGATAGGLLSMQARRRGAPSTNPDPPTADPLLGQLRSATGPQARLERAALEDGWRELRRRPVGAAETEAAFATVLRARRAVGAAEALVRAQRAGWAAAVGEALPARLVPELEAAATVLARSERLGAEARQAIGWQWGACGSRRCGAQADAAQALCKLRANLGMLLPLEALFYLDIAKRALDEILALDRSAAGRAAAPRSEYLSKETLENFLVKDDEEHAFLMPERRGVDPAEAEVEEEERRLLEEAGLL